MAKKSKSKKSKSSKKSSVSQFTSGDDVVVGTVKNDNFKAKDGNDLVSGLGGE